MIRYIQTPFLDGLFNTLPQHSKERRAELTKNGENIRKLDDKQIKNLKFYEQYDTNNNNYFQRTVQEKIDMASTQVKEFMYKLPLIFENLPPVYGLVLVGVSTTIVGTLLESERDDKT